MSSLRHLSTATFMLSSVLPFSVLPASLAVVSAACNFIQNARFESDVFSLVTADGRITIPANRFMSFGEVYDENLLKAYVNFIKRDKMAASFRSQVNLDWGTSPGGIRCKLSLNLLVIFPDEDLVTDVDGEPMDIENRPPVISPASTLSSLSDEVPMVVDNRLFIITPASTFPSQLYTGLEAVADIRDIIQEEVNDPILQEIMQEVSVPPSLKRRLSKKENYSAKTLTKYACSLERQIVDVISKFSFSQSSNLKKQVVDEVLRKLTKKYGGSCEDSVPIKKIVTNIKNLVNEMRQYGANDIEQIRFQKAYL